MLNDTLMDAVTTAQMAPLTRENILRTIPLLELTRLAKEDDEDTIIALCAQANTPFGPVAGVCVFPHYLTLAKTCLIETPAHLVTVANFPSGNTPLPSVLIELEQAKLASADEIDVVFPYQDFLRGGETKAFFFIKECLKALAPAVKLKVILETAVYPELTMVQYISTTLAELGVDFIKTSTGKIFKGATLEATAAILCGLQAAKIPFHKKTGLKIAGGIKTAQQACQYLTLIDTLMGREFVSPQTLRFGASELLIDLMRKL